MKSKTSALCTDQVSTASGVVSNQTDEGCEFHTEQSHHDAPVFPRRTNVDLCLIEESSGKVKKVRARLSGISRSQGLWTYRIRWSAKAI